MRFCPPCRAIWTTGTAVRRGLTKHFFDQVLHVVLSGRLVHQERGGPQRTPGKERTFFRTMGQDQFFAVAIEADLVFAGNGSAAHGVDAHFAGLALGGAPIAAEYRWRRVSVASFTES